MWIGFIVRTAATCLLLAAFVSAIGWLHRPIEWRCALLNTPLRPETRVYGMVEDMPMVGIRGMPVRLFGIDFRQPSRGLSAPFIGEPACDLICGDPVIVQLPYSELGDMQMPLIAQATKLRSLALDGTRITDEGLRHLIGLQNLETLSISHTDITDKGAEILGRLHSLKYLNVRGTRLTGAALEHLARLDWLKALDLSQTALDGGGLASLHALSNLQSLNLDYVPLGDDDVAALGTLTSLCNLQLRGTRVTREGVANLATLNRLETCSIEGAFLTRREIDAIRKSRNE